MEIKSITDERKPGRQVAVIGGSRAEGQELMHAEQVGILLARNGAILLSGGRGGVMEASCLGAYNAGGIVDRKSVV